MNLWQGLALIVATPIVAYVIARVVFHAYFEAKRQHTHTVLNELDRPCDKPK